MSESELRRGMSNTECNDRVVRICTRLMMRDEADGLMAGWRWLPSLPNCPPAISLHWCLAAFRPPSSFDLFGPFLLPSHANAHSGDMQLSMQGEITSTQDYETPIRHTATGELAAHGFGSESNAGVGTKPPGSCGSGGDAGSLSSGVSGSTTWWILRRSAA